MARSCYQAASGGCPKGSCRCVELPQQHAHRGGAVERPQARVDELAFDVAERFPSFGVEAGADHARRTGEPDRLEMAQQRVHRRGPWPCLGKIVSSTISTAPGPPTSYCARSVSTR